MKPIHVIASAAWQSIFVRTSTKGRWIAASPTLLAMTMFLFISSAYALTVDQKLVDSAQESRAQALFHALRCVVCEGEAIADSPAEVAGDMRRAVRAEIAAGKDDEAIMSSLVARYGERVLMMPQKNKRNALLWLMPLMLLAGGGVMAWKTIFRKEVP